MFGYQSYLLFYTDEGSKKLWGLVDLPWDYRKMLLALVAANCVLSYTYEKWFIGWFARYKQQSEAD